MNKLKFKKVWSKSIILALIAVSCAWSSAVFALGMGAAVADSHIGEPLSVHIPLFNVNEPDELSALIQRLDNATGSMPLDAKVERKNSQLGIRITSTKQTAEPYVSFIIDVVDGGSLVSKEFTVLLDLDSSRETIGSQTRVQQQVVSNTRSTSNQNTSNQNVFNSPSGGVMGPYDWAQPNQVADTFGPVLDGQSLWRVARRMNKALGVSIDQMMWSLYQNNRDKFSTDEITSLKAGVFLQIPTAQQASQISELEAKRNVERSSSRSFSTPSSASSGITSVSRDSELTSDLEIEAIDESDENRVNLPDQEQKSFDLTGIDLSDKPEAGGSGSIDGKSQEIIASLAESVGNLTQEIIKKDQKIAFLEEKVEALEKYAQVSAAELANAPQELLTLPESATAVASTVNRTNVETQPQLNSSINTTPVQVEQSSYEFKWWHGILLLLLLLLVVSYIFRDRLMALVKSLHLFGEESEIEFDPSEYEKDDEEFERAVLDAVDPDLTAENNPQGNGLSQKSILDAIKTAVQVDDPLSPQTLLDLDGEYSYTEAFPDIELERADEVNLSFVERYNVALKKQDFGFALQLLNMARDNEIDQATYHYYRLNMYEAMHNEDAFYDYFCEIENEISSFPNEMQTKISQLVLQMAQH